MMFRIFLFLLIVVLVVSCSEKAPDDTRKKLTQRQRDSILAESPLPGAKAVGKAITVSDSATVRAKRLDEKTKQ